MRTREFSSVGAIFILGYCFLLAIPAARFPADPDTNFRTPPVVVLDPGHGGNDNGGYGNGIQEKALALDLAFRVQKILNAASLTTILTRQTDQYVALSDRAHVANSLRHCIFISLHANVSADPAAVGAETFYTAPKYEPLSAWDAIGLFNPPSPLAPDQSEQLAAALQSTVVAELGEHDRGIKNRDLFVTRNTYHSAVLIEVGFLTNPPEAAQFDQESYRQKIAQAIADGIQKFIHTPQPPPSPKTPALLATPVSTPLPAPTAPLPAPTPNPAASPLTTNSAR